MNHGNPENASVWTHADVLLSFEDEPAVPATIDDDFGVDWEYLGILNGDTGISETPSATLTKHAGWGFGIIAETEKDFDMEWSFTGRETNPVVARLMQIDEDGYQSYGPAVQAFVAVRLYYGDREKRKMSVRKCQVRRSGPQSATETSIEEYGFMVTLVPDEEGRRVLIQPNPTDGS
jgi:hypothetical protein